MKTALLPITTTITLVIAAAILLPFLSAPDATAQETAADNDKAWSGQKWEYRVRRIDDRRSGTDRETGTRKSRSEEVLDELGAQGWELVAVRPEGSSPVFYFKRPVSSTK